jgi:hypothetical protein
LKQFNKKREHLCLNGKLAELQENVKKEKNFLSFEIHGAVCCTLNSHDERINKSLSDNRRLGYKRSLIINGGTIYAQENLNDNGEFHHIFPIRLILKLIKKQDGSIREFHKLTEKEKFLILSATQS